MSETTTRTCDGCGADISGDYVQHWTLTFEAQGLATLCQDTSEKHLCTDCAVKAVPTLQRTLLG